MDQEAATLDDWEDWDPNSGTSFLIHAAAGSLAGAAEHCVMFPFDTIKTYSQAAGTNNSFSAFRTFITTESQTFNRPSFLRPWRGVSTMLTACIPAHAMYFSIFEQGKIYFNANIPEQHTPIAAAFCGMLATLAHDSIMTPMDVVKQRLQLGFYKGPIDALKCVIKNDGLKALYRSYPTTLIMNIPYAGVVVSVNESCKKILNPKEEYNVPAFLASGAIAGCVAAAFTNPLDVVKTRLQTQNLMQTLRKSSVSHMQNKSVTMQKSKLFDRLFSNGPMGTQGPVNLAFRYNYSYTNSMNTIRKFPGKCLCFPYYPPPSSRGSRQGTTTLSTNYKKQTVCLCERKKNFSTGVRTVEYKGLIETVNRIYLEEGARGFTRGLRSRLMVHAPSVAISWTTYETAKSILMENFDDN